MDPEIPGQPLLSVSDKQKVIDFLKSDLLHDDLNKLHSVFWLASRGEHISPLHEQIVKEREIVVTEDPGLHLLWYHDRVFIKPLPPYLTSHAFWEKFLCDENPVTVDLRKAALGYLRSYCHLIKYQSDFNIAKDKKLIAEGVDAKALLRFLHSFESVSKDDVTLRYRDYSELRLSRINFYIKFYKFQYSYREMRWKYRDYLNGLIAPFAFTFALASAALSAMQVVLAAQPPNGNQSHGWQKFTSASQWSSVVLLIFIAGCIIVIPFLVCYPFYREFIIAFGLRLGRLLPARRTVQQAPGLQSEHRESKVNL